MARGFAKGLFQGAILCGAALAALSLALPIPDSTMPIGSNARSAPGPDAANMELPVGSEFARSDDMQPVSPAPLTRPEMAALGDAPIVQVPADETAPRLATATALRPEMATQAPGAPLALSPVRENLELPAAPSHEAPIPVAPPGRVVTPALDRMPEGLGQTLAGADESLPQTPSQNPQDRDPRPHTPNAPKPPQLAVAGAPAATVGADPSQAGAAHAAHNAAPQAVVAQSTTPASTARQPAPVLLPAGAATQLPRPAALDLSTPPDLGGLGLVSRP